jgi:hypothetical protein
MARFRGKTRVLFMEVGVQSGGKIPMLRDYFGPGFVYVGLDINPSTKRFETVDWVHIEIGDSGSRQFWEYIKQKYPHVDIFLDDGGHTMQQQILGMEMMLPHVQPEGVYICEDLQTSWVEHYGGMPMTDVRNFSFVENTMVGLIHQTLDMLTYHWINDFKPAPSNFFPQPWWLVVPTQVKHIHYYNGLVVYEKGHVYGPHRITTMGHKIPYEARPYNPNGPHPPVDWDQVMKEVQIFTKAHG